MLRGENICDFDRLFLFDSSAQFFFKFHKISDSPKPVLSYCKRMIFVDYIMNALKHSKVRLPFLYALYVGHLTDNLRAKLDLLLEKVMSFFHFVVSVVDDAIWPRSIFSFMMQCIITVSLIY